MKMLKQTPGVFPVMARDGWPKDGDKTYQGAKAVVYYMDGGGRHPVIQPGHMDVVKKLIDGKAGFVNLHYAVEYPKEYNDRVFPWLGGYYETGFSTNPHWGRRLQEAAGACDRARRQAVHHPRRMVLQHPLRSRHEGRDADPEGDAA